MKTIPPYRSVEWQAKALCGEITIPYEATIGMTAKEIMAKYNVLFKKFTTGEWYIKTDTDSKAAAFSVAVFPRIPPPPPFH